jgi:hypothetical protein
VSEDLILLFILGVIAWLWWDGRGVSERATTAARSYCVNAGVNFLNDTVSWQRYRLRRNRAGRVQIQRTYFFEFASDMQQRYRGEIVMLGQQVQSISLDAFRIG